MKGTYIVKLVALTLFVFLIIQPHSSRAEPHPLSISSVVTVHKRNDEIVLVRAQITGSVEGLILSDVNCGDSCIPSIFLSIPDRLDHSKDVRNLFKCLKEAGRRDRYLVVTVRARVLSTMYGRERLGKVRRLELISVIRRRLAGRRL
jgi:hypothetical protein